MAPKRKIEDANLPVPSKMLQEMQEFVDRMRSKEEEEAASVKAAAEERRQRRRISAQARQEEISALAAERQQQQQAEHAEMVALRDDIRQETAQDREAFLAKHKFGRASPSVGDTIEKRREAMEDAYNEVCFNMSTGFMAYDQSPHLLAAAFDALHQFTVKVRSRTPVFQRKGGELLIGVPAVADLVQRMASAAPRRRR